MANVYASPVAAGDAVYLTGRDGVTQVIKAGPEYEVIANNELDQGADASLAVIGDQLLLRTKDHLYCIGHE